MLDGQNLCCPVVAGRDGEQAAIGTRLGAARAGMGGVVVVEGEAGIGKSRLAGDAAEQAARLGMRTLWGRAAPGSALAFRPLAEALLSSQRSAPATTGDSALAPYRAALGRLVPEWRDPTAVGEESLVVVAEAVVRVVGGLAAEAGLLLVLEDLHWSDPETLTVLEYLVDNLSGVPACLLVTLRPLPPDASGLFRRLAGRGAVTHLDLLRLPPEVVASMTAACLGVRLDEVPDEVLQLMAASSGGLPLVVEDLLAAAVASGGLLRHDGGWRAELLDGLRPQRFAQTVDERLALLSPVERAVVDAAAVLGRSFAWELLGPALDLSEAEVEGALRAATGLQLVAAEPSGFRFRHALIREVVLDGLLPPVRSRVSRRLAEVLEGERAVADDASACLLAAELRTAAGDREEAAGLLLTGGQAAVRRGALVTAAGLLREGWRLAGDGPLEATLGHALVETLTLGGDARAALDLAPHVVSAVERADPGQAAETHAVLAPAGPGDVARHARLAALDAHLALASTTGDRLVAAEHLAWRAVAAAEAAQLPAVECEALEVVGRCARVRDLATAEEAFARALAVADDHGLAVWRVRALNELGTVDMFRSVDPARLEQARAEAERLGALSTVTGVDVNLAALHTMRGEYTQALDAARRCEATARRYRLPVLAAALLFQAVVATHEGRFRDMQRLVQAAEAEAGDDPDILIGTWSMCRAVRSLLQEDRRRAQHELATAAAKVQASPALAINPCDGPRLLLRAVDGQAGDAEVAAFELDNAVGARWSELWGGAARAVVVGRAGDGVGAAAAFDRATLAAERMPLFRLFAVRLASESALADGWGDPTAWLVETERGLAARGHEEMASACRSLLRRSDARLGRTRRADAVVDAALRRHGVTAREAEVLALVGTRMSNQEIADRLYLSPRTVEKHVSSLLAKTGASSRAVLAALGRDLEDGGTAPM